ncbi:MAG TPA: HDOD domain-containing protein [Dissulfurispiraceae bacterium]|nr:HDOD domain-containing protein [Dissulfurispiraceae bacterium]
MRYISSGTFSVSRRKKTVLTAILGTCVGVVLVDRAAGVGGLAHILLPAPTDPKNPIRPESYASTALPLFIEQLCRIGADIKRLEAVVAGGALIGSISGRDLDLDIGGRISNVVTCILFSENVTIRESETGGMHGMILSLDLDTLEHEISPLVNPPQHYVIDIEKPGEEEIARAIAGVRPIPQIALKIMRMTADSSYNLQDVAAEVRQDQIITAKVLNLCNSALCGRKAPIDSIDEALMVLGEKTLLAMILSSVVQGCYPECERVYSTVKGRLFHHAIGTALIADNLARRTGLCNPLVAYTAGLLHDIGKIVLDHFVANRYPLFYRKTVEDMLSLENAELEILGVGHPAVGAKLANLWSIPENLAEAIRYHHRPENATIDSVLTHVVCLADIITCGFWTSQAIGRQDQESLSDCLNKLGLNADIFKSVVDSSPWDILNDIGKSES